MQSISLVYGLHPKKKIIWIDVEILVAAAYIETFKYTVLWMLIEKKLPKKLMYV